MVRELSSPTHHSPFSHILGGRKHFRLPRHVFQVYNHPRRKTLSPKSSSLSPCPGLHVYKSHSPPKSSLSFKSALTGPKNVKRLSTEILSKNHPQFIGASEGSTRSSNAASPFRPQEQQWPLEPATLTRSYIMGRDAGNPPSRVITNDVTSPLARRNQGYVTMPNTPSGPLSGTDQYDNPRFENSSPSKTVILSPHAIPTDLIDPQATWNRLPQTGDRTNDYVYEQALRPQGSIADRLSSMVERGWEGGDTFCKDNDESASHTTKSKFHIGDARRHSRSDFFSETSRQKELPSYSGSLSVSTAQLRSESQHSSGQDALRYVKLKEPLILMDRESKKRRQRQAKRSPAIDATPRSSSDSGVHYLRTELANPKGKRRAWTLHHFGQLIRNHSQIQQEAYATTWRNHRDSEPDHKSPESTPPHEGSIPKSGLERTIRRDEQFHPTSEARPKLTASRRSSSNAKESTRTSSRSTSIFKKFPWYKVALVNKQPVNQDLLKEGQSNHWTSESSRAAQQDPTANQVGLSRGVSKSHTPAGSGHELDEDALKSKTPSKQGLTNQQAMDARTSYHKVSSEASLQLMTSPQEMNKRQLLEQSQRAPERPQYSQATSFKTTQDRLSGNSHQVAKEVVVERTQSSTGTGLSSTQPRVSPRPGSVNASFESAMSGNILQSLQSQWPGVKEHYGMQAYTSPSVDSTKRRDDSRPEQSSSDSRAAKVEEGFTVSPDPSQQLGLKVVNLSPVRLETCTDSLPASVQRSDQDGSVHREVKGKGKKGIKKIQITISFDGVRTFRSNSFLFGSKPGSHNTVWGFLPLFCIEPWAARPRQRTQANIYSYPQTWPTSPVFRPLIKQY